jgi:AraC family transcriptional regulator, ethanolamine operon transcriptional activator
MQNGARHHDPSVRVGEFSYKVVESSDARRHEQALNGLRHAYHQVDRVPFHARLTELRLGPARILRDELNHPIDYVGESIAGNMVFFVFIPHTCNAFWDGRPVDAGTLIKYPGDQPHRAFCNGPSECIGVLFDEEDLIAFARERGLGHLDPHAIHRNLYLSEPDIVCRFLERANCILREAGSEPGLLENDVWRAQALDSVLGVLLEILEAGVADPGKLPPPPTRAYIVEKAIGFVTSSLSDPPSMQWICDTLRVSSRTLRYSFEEILGVSPTQYMLALRLNAVRSKLLEGVPTSCINRIAQDHGFGHMGRFAQFYREAFGELPSQTCRSSVRDADVLKEIPTPGARDRRLHRGVQTGSHAEHRLSA